MEKIRNKLDISDRILPKAYWDVKKSGKVLELRVLPSIDQSPEKYRLGIIQIGRIISRIQMLTKYSETKPQIQLFPNLAENQLAATVYWPAFLENMTQEKHNQDQVQDHLPPLTVQCISKYAEHYDLSLSSDSTHTVEDGEMKTYYVVSQSNQPFIWLKVGQFIQDLTEHNDDSDGSSDISIEVPMSYIPEHDASGKKAGYRQVKIKAPADKEHHV
ncbi:hypothetical protein [Rhodohalobacter sp. 8-1]|uniref:hypothetical protein n=1 Tax=Rhodohalobacter sp. 8-1 TaxID=3131972 RepID=UPI0030EB6B5F